VVADPPWALARLVAHFNPPLARPPGVHPTALVDPGCEVAKSAHIGPFAVVGAGSRIGERAAVLAHAVVGRNCRIGEEAVVHPHAVLYDATEIGARAIVHAGAVLGADGFGYVTRGGAHHKVPQVGRAVIEADVEVGANTAIDRGALGDTRIGEGTKIDDHVMIGHNVQVGRHCILCGQVGIAGSARLGDGVVMGGRAAAIGHLEIGDGVQVASGGGVMASVAPGAKVAGIPAIDLRAWRRQTVLLARLEEMQRRLRALEKRRPGQSEED
jgi:UDP-3-O-[3-hydroxymyristoyl] glucosamine N-acyltransferase